MRKACADFTERLAGWQLKALREAKLATDWTAPNLEYEDAARSFLYTIMADRERISRGGLRSLQSASVRPVR